MEDICDILRNFVCRTCEENFGKALEHEEKLCNEVKTRGQFRYLFDRVSTDGGCEAAVTT